MHYYALVVSSLVFVFIESNYLKIFFSFILPTVVAVSSLLFFFTLCLWIVSLTTAFYLVLLLTLFLFRLIDIASYQDVCMSAVVFCCSKYSVWILSEVLLPHPFPEIIGFAWD